MRSNCNIYLYSYNISIFYTQSVIMFVLINKPSWCTSFDVIRKLKRLYKWEKIGHAWTLDPLATWLLIVAIGKDTKKISQYVWMDKTYTATIDFSKDSDTWDTDYRKYYEEFQSDDWWIYLCSDALSMRQEWQTNTLKVSEQSTYITAPTQQQIEEQFTSILGYHPLPLTPFSAKKRKWKKLYEYAREWNPVFINIDMQLLDFKVISYGFPVLEIELRVWSWTYIRSIAHWLGKQFWLPGILSALHRSKVGEFGLK